MRPCLPYRQRERLKHPFRVNVHFHILSPPSSIGHYIAFREGSAADVCFFVDLFSLSPESEPWFLEDQPRNRGLELYHGVLSVFVVLTLMLDGTLERPLNWPFPTLCSWGGSVRQA